MVGFAEARENYKHPEKVVVTGTPVRLGFMRSDKSAARRALGIAEDEPLVVSVWGSLGATEMNKTVARMIALAWTARSVPSARPLGGQARHKEHDGVYERRARPLRLEGSRV